jgi:hypothetical protein
MSTAQFAFDFFSFVLLNGIVLTSAVFLAVFLNGFEIKDWKKFILSVAILFFSQVFLSEIIMGMFGILSFRSVLLVNAMFLIVVSLFIGKTVIKKARFSKFSFKYTFTFLAVFSPFIAILLLRYYNALFQIPMEYDTVSYHLPFVLEWLKTGNLWKVYYSAFAGPLGYYPSNFELFALWSYLPFGKDYLVNLINLPIFPLLLLSIYAVARNLKIDGKIALLVAALFLYMPQTFRQMGTPLVDLFFCFTFMAAIYFVQEFWRSKSQGDLFLLGLSAGLFVGTKYLGVPYVLPLLLIAFLGLLIPYIRNFRAIAKGIAVLSAGIFLTGSFWYVRNLIDTGNPIFPMEINLFGVKIFEGYYGLAERVLGYSLASNVHDWAGLNEFLNGFLVMVGFPTFLMALAFVSLPLMALFYGLKYVFFRRLKIAKAIPGRILIIVLLFLSGIYFFYFYWKAPYTYINLIPNVRYAMMFLLIGCLTVGVVASYIRPLRGLFYFLSFLCLSSNLIFLTFSLPAGILNNDKMLLDFGIFWPYRNQLLLFGIIIATLCLSYWMYQYWTKKRYLAFMPALLSLFLIIQLFLITIPHRESLRKYYFDFWYKPESAFLATINASTHAVLWFDQSAPNAKIAYTGFNFIYHFFGRSLDREVNYVNINECLECTYKDYKSSPDSIRRDPSYENWIKNLKAFQKDYLVVTPDLTAGVKSFEQEWAKTHPDHFQQVFEENGLYIYKITF